MDRRILYHCTSRDWGLFLPVKNQSPRFPARGEPDTPRLCVADSIAGCFASRLYNPRRPLFVYRTRRAMSGISPIGVWDSELTGERWLRPPTILICCEVLSAAIVRDAQSLIYGFHEITGRRGCIDSRIVALCEAYAALGQKRPLRLQEMVDSRDSYTRILSLCLVTRG